MVGFVEGGLGIGAGVCAGFMVVVVAAAVAAARTPLPKAA
jgi:hypothetical protein